jgi:hypothetical protein
MVTPADNLASLHRLEEQLREQSLAVITNDPTLSEHWTFLAQAMGAIYTFTHDHPHTSNDELTLQYLGVRLFNAAGASIKLATVGYYQKAFHQVRDILETSFLVDYLSTYPEKIDDWRRADKKNRIAQFGPGVIRNALDKRDGYTSGERKRFYDLISEAASHPTHAGIALTATGPDNLVQVGPFFDQKKLRVWLQEIVLRLSPAALHLMSDAGGNDLGFLAARMHYLEVARSWWSKYHGLNITEVGPRFD